MNYKNISKSNPRVIGSLKEASVLVLIKKKTKNRNKDKDKDKAINLKSSEIELDKEDDIFNIDLENDEIIFEKRAMGLRSQPGDISFPGGKIDEGETSEAAAIRETFEEIAIKKENIRLIGRMDFVVTPYKNVVYPFIGVTYQDNYVISSEEVERVITIPLRDLLNATPKVVKVNLKQIPYDDFPYEKVVGGKAYPFKSVDNLQYFYSFQDIHIWGLTALILREFLQDITKLFMEDKKQGNINLNNKEE